MRTRTIILIFLLSISLTVNYKLYKYQEADSTKQDEKYQTKIKELQTNLERTSKERALLLDSINNINNDYRDLLSLGKQKDQQIRSLKKKYQDYQTKPASEIEAEMIERWKNSN
jgi:vacuolar-type H+-ATPase subunit I/STV1